MVYGSLSSIATGQASTRTILTGASGGECERPRSPERRTRARHGPSDEAPLPRTGAECGRSARASSPGFLREERIRLEDLLHVDLPSGVRRHLREKTTVRFVEVAVKDDLAAKQAVVDGDLRQNHR